jgi:hypothetical protein
MTIHRPPKANKLAKKAYKRRRHFMIVSYEDRRRTQPWPGEFMVTAGAHPLHPGYKEWVRGFRRMGGKNLWLYGRH